MVETFGVEEEFVLVDEEGKLVHEAPETLSDAPDDADLKPELLRSQVESNSPVCTTAAKLAAELADLRGKLAASAEGRGLRLIASGTAVHPQREPAQVGPDARYHRMIDHFGSLVFGGVTSGCHVHVGVADPEQRIQVLNHLRPWLPVLLALSANSPFQDGRETGYASTRYLLWGRWPTSGPPPHLGSVAEYERVVDGMIRSEAAMDRGMIYWDVRPSEHQDTVELRVHDVQTTVAEATLLAVLSRQLVHEATEEPLPGDDPIPHQVLEGHLWRAARDGFHTIAVDPRTHEPAPVADILTDLVARIAVAEDRDYAAEVLASLKADGNGADRQRAAFRRGSNLDDVVDTLARQTIADQ